MKRPYFRRSYYLRCDIQRVTFLLMLAVLVLVPLGGRAAWAEKRVALIIGNSAYVHTTPLANPLNDARDMTEALKATGFEVVEAIDADKLKLDGALRSFTDKLADADVALFYYAGHGLQVGAQNYLVPVDAKLDRERDLEFEAVKLDFVLRQMEIDREGKTSIVILDACRDNPLTRNLARSMGTRSAGIGRGLAAAATGLGTFIAYSTQPGNVALDGKGRNSPFTAALAKHVRVKGRNLPATMIEVRREVLAATGGKQVPWDHSAMTGDFYFVAGDAAPSPGTVHQAPAGTSDDVAALQARLAKLEAEATERSSAAATAPNPAPGAMIAADGIKLAELRARAASLEDMTKELQKKLFAARLEEGKALDPNEKMKLQRKSIDIQSEWTRRGLDFRKLKDEIAVLEEISKLEGKAASAAATVATNAPPIVPKPKAAKTSPNFEDADNVMLTGAGIRAFKAPNPIACREACEADTTCVAYQHGKKAANMGQCELFSFVTVPMEDYSWRSGVRREGASAATANPRENAGLLVRPDQITFPVAVTRSKQGFDFFEGVAVTGGDSIKDVGIHSADGCMVACRHTPGCAVAFHRPLSPLAPGQFMSDKTQFCALYRGVRSFTTQPDATSITRATP